MKPTFRCMSHKGCTVAELGGKTIGEGITGIAFSHNPNGDVVLTLTIDLKDFKFMEDGEFDEILKQVSGLPEKEQPQVISC